MATLGQEVPTLGQEVPTAGLAQENRVGTEVTSRARILRGLQLVQKIDQ